MSLRTKPLKLVAMTLFVSIPVLLMLPTSSGLFARVFLVAHRSASSSKKPSSAVFREAPPSMRWQIEQSGATKRLSSSSRATPAVSSSSPAPDRWREQLEGIRYSRQSRDAAVDLAGANALKRSSMGTPDDVRFQKQVEFQLDLWDGKHLGDVMTEVYSCSDRSEMENKIQNTKSKHFKRKVLMSAMLSSQTKDPVTAAALDRMRKACLPAPLGAAALAATVEEEELATLLHPVSFAKTKARNIMSVCELLAKPEEGRDAGVIPCSVEGLLSLPGVGPKMAYLVMDVAWGCNVGICVDTHVHRISNRLGWVETWNFAKPRAQNPEKTRKALQAWLPREHWSEINGLLVGFGQQVCRALGPSCSTCGIRDICPSAATGGDVAWQQQQHRAPDQQGQR